MMSTEKYNFMFQQFQCYKICLKMLWPSLNPSNVKQGGGADDVEGPLFAMRSQSRFRFLPSCATIFGAVSGAARWIRLLLFQMLKKREFPFS